LKTRGRKNNLHKNGGVVMKANILVCGRTGVGKTSLLQTICGKDVVPDKMIGHAEPTTMDYTKYEFDQFVFWDSPGFEPGENTRDYVSRIQSFIHKKLVGDDSSDRIHILWYCISGEGARIQEFDEIFATKFPFPTFVVLTKDDITSRQQRKAMAEELDKKNFSLGSLFTTSSEKKTGIDRLLRITNDKLPEGIVIGERMKQRINELEVLKRKRADATVYWAAGRAAGIAIIPIPVADVFPLSANELYMISRIGSVYGISLSNSMVTAFVGILGASFVGKILASFLPGVKIAIAFAVTYGVGKAAQAWFEKDMKMSEEELKKIYNKEYKEKYKEYKDKSK
jgi:uncharacterized protein (DUF697 family)/GTP-binding protein EngB required for normal cell division